MTINIGEKLKQINLKDQNGDLVKLEDLKGKKILLSFHPLAWTGVCTKQMQSLEDNYDAFMKNDTIPLGINVDPVPSKKAWAEDMGLQMLKIISDFWPHGKLAKELDIFIDEDGISGRVNILLDESGEVIWVKEYDIPELPDIEEVLTRIKEVD
ncbi:MAG: redoxin domain-containing protein [Halothermotrichaceae bacterium]